MESQSGITQKGVLVGAVLATLFCLAFVWGSVMLTQNASQQTVGDIRRDESQFYVASSTTFTLTTSSQRLLATSSLRVSATIQPQNCVTGANVYLKMQQDQPATANGGFLVQASTTGAFGSGNVPVAIGAVTGITTVGACSVIVTEWTRQY